jgi:hypothetical protein
MREPGAAPGEMREPGAAAGEMREMGKRWAKGPTMATTVTGGARLLERLEARPSTPEEPS